MRTNRPSTKQYKEIADGLSANEGMVFYMLRDGKSHNLSNIYAKVYIETAPTRTQQMRLGPIIARLNRKLAPVGWIIKPGEPRRTYRLYARFDV